MPRDSIERAIKKSQGADAANYEEVRYEGRGPGGVALIVEALTDNRNRTASDVRSLFSKHGGQMGETVAYMFDRLGQIQYPAAAADADAMLDAAIEAGADDCQSTDQTHDLTCAPDDLNEVSRALEKRFGPPASAKFVWRPQTARAGRRRRRPNPDRPDRRPRRPRRRPNRLTPTSKCPTPRWRS